MKKAITILMLLLSIGGYAQNYERIGLRDFGFLMEVYFTDLTVVGHNKFENDFVEIGYQFYMKDALAKIKSEFAESKKKSSERNYDFLMLEDMKCKSGSFDLIIADDYAMALIENNAKDKGTFIIMKAKDKSKTFPIKTDKMKFYSQKEEDEFLKRNDHNRHDLGNMIDFVHSLQSAEFDD